jgi:hypothetical protein
MGCPRRLRVWSGLPTRHPGPACHRGHTGRLQPRVCPGAELGAGPGSADHPVRPQRHRYVRVPVRPACHLWGRRRLPHPVVLGGQPSQAVRGGLLPRVPSVIAHGGGRWTRWGRGRAGAREWRCRPGCGPRWWCWEWWWWWWWWCGCHVPCTRPHAAAPQADPRGGEVAVVLRVGEHHAPSLSPPSPHPTRRVSCLLLSTPAMVAGACRMRR